jgi:hypothetical protein
MDSFRDTVTVLASALRTFFRLLEAIPTVAWLTALVGLIMIGSIGAIAHARRERQRVESAVLKIAGRNIESLSAANLRRRVNQSLRMQVVLNTAVIHGEDLTITWKCLGYCRGGRETSIEFSVDSDNNIPFHELRCSAYDLQHDPKRRHPVRPILVGPDGISKKVAVPFLAPVGAGQLFNVLFTCELPGCMKAGVEYYTASLSFEHDDALQYAVRLLFLGTHPQWLRVYETGPGLPKSVKQLRPARVNDDAVEYEDALKRLAAKSIRIYVFERPAAAAARDSDTDEGARRASRPA